MSGTVYLCIDRIENGVAVLESDSRESFSVSVADLPEGCREGDCLYRDEAGALLRDEGETARRRKRNFDLFQSLLEP